VGKREDLIRAEGRRFSATFKRQVVQELLSRRARKGNPYDNAVAESFLKTLKCEAVYLWDYRHFGGCEREDSLFNHLTVRN